jgi:hypothetical protein
LKQKILRYKIWYNKNKKSTGKPLMVLDMLTGKITTTDKFEMKDCEIRIAFNNSDGPAKRCGATTILEVYI